MSAPVDPVPPVAVAAEPGVPDKRSFRVLFLIVLADMIGFGIILPILPVYARDFGASVWQVTLLMSVYSLCQLVASPFLGSVSDRVGRRPVLMFSQFGSGVASLTLAYATYRMMGTTAGLWVVYASRILDGFSAGNLATAQAYVADTVAPKEKSKYMGMLGAAFGIGFTLGPTLGGLLGHFNPALAPLVAAAFSLTAAVLSYFYLPESLKAPIVHKEGQLRRSIALLRVPVLAQINVIWFLAMFAFVSAESVFALYLEDGYGFGLPGIGLMFGLAGLVIIGVQGRAIGPLARRFGDWNLAAAGPFVFAGAMALFALSTAHPVMWLLIIAVLLNATGRSLQTPSLSALLSHQATPVQQGVAFGLFQGFGSLARVFGPAVAGVLYDRRHVLPYLMAALLTLIAGAWTLLLRTQAGGPQDATPPSPVPASA